ncbi:MAG TPA: M28 family peptidase [Pyrinomonadaceae bacterium]|nr:M28 family peptidase [Pyrinomonadaceae bacterium]
MKRLISLLVILAFVVPLVRAQDLTAKFDPNEMRERVKRLSSDDFEGRGPGTEGGRHAAQYIADQMKAAGIVPANRGSYFQNVPLVGVKADPNTVLTVSGKNGNESFKFGDDFVVTTGAQSADISVNADLVFVGYGIDAPLYNWNDYKGDPNQYRGKVLVMLVNDPPATDSEPSLFGGKALTYFGRWTYKYEEAARRGAVGVLLIHTTNSAGYGWNVVRTSNGNWRYEIARSPSDKTPYLNAKAWVTNDTAEKIFKSANADLEKLKKAAQKRDFTPVTLGLTARIDLKSETQKFNSPNVVGMVKGSDPKLSSEYVVFSAHWDHLGIGEPDKNGDRIFNGAYDNASGVATVLAIGEVVAKMPLKERPKRSILILSPTAEEQGLLGAEYYSTHPLVPLAKTAADINIDGVNFFGKVSDFMPLGAQKSTLLSVINEVAKEKSLTVKSDSRPEQGFFFRSDHFPFAKVGVPSINLQHGENFVTPLTGEAQEFFKDYTAKYYHQVTDEYHEWWDMSAMIQEAELALQIGIKVANSPAVPHFLPNDEFAAADKRRSTTH